MDIRPIRTEADYKAALREVSAYFDHEPEPGTPDGHRFEVLLTLVEDYETRYFPIDLPDPLEQVLATRSVIITELKRSPSAVLERLNADLRQAIQEGIDSGPAIPAEKVLAELNARYAEPPKRTTKPGGKRTA